MVGAARRSRSLTGWSRTAVIVLGLAITILVWLLSASSAHAATVIDYQLQKATVVYRQPIVVGGSIQPAAADQEIAVALDGTDIAVVRTAADGTFTHSFTPKVGGVVTARVVADGTVGPELPFGVQPRIVTRVTGAKAYFKAKIRVVTSPKAYRGKIVARVIHNGSQVGKVSRWVRNGKAKLVLPAPGVGRFKVKITLEARGGFAERTVVRSFKTTFRTLRLGSRGPDVKLLLKQLRRLRFRIPGISTYYSWQVADAVMAFQKAYGLPRTYVFNADDWRKLDRAKELKPRYSSPYLHIEISKPKQILMVVRNGRPLGILAVSTGATGNTPVGTHRILWKAYSAPTPYGGLLYWDMEFYPSFAMHAYPSVPPYPASHGCVRQPNWVAPWTYRVSSVGETVYVY